MERLGLETRPKHALPGFHDHLLQGSDGGARVETEPFTTPRLFGAQSAMLLLSIRI